MNRQDYLQDSTSSVVGSDRIDNFTEYLGLQFLCRWIWSRMTAKKTLRRHANGSFKPGQLPGIYSVKPKKKRIHSGIYSATVMEVDTWLIFRECLLFGFSKQNLITVRRSTRGTNY